MGFNSGFKGLKDGRKYPSCSLQPPTEFVSTSVLCVLLPSSPYCKYRYITSVYYNLSTLSTTSSWIRTTIESKYFLYVFLQIYTYLFVSESGDFATLFFFWFSNTGADAAITSLLPTLKRFSCNRAADWSTTCFCCESVLKKRWKFCDPSAWISKRVPDSLLSCCSIRPCHQPGFETSRLLVRH